MGGKNEQRSLNNKAYRRDTIFQVEENKEVHNKPFNKVRLFYFKNNRKFLVTFDSGAGKNYALKNVIEEITVELFNLKNNPVVKLAYVNKLNITEGAKFVVTHEEMQQEISF